MKVLDKNLKHNIHNLFMCPVYYTYLEKENFLNETQSINLKLLKNYVFSIKKKSKGRVKSNLGGWQSFDVKLDEPVLKNLNNAILERAKVFADSLFFKKNLSVVFTNAWFNINDYGHSNMDHIHPGSQLSGVFYLQTSKDTGGIVFNSNNNNIEYDWTENLIEKYTEWNSASYIELADTMKLFLFPSWLRHRVETNLDKKISRISYSFNLNLVNN